MDIGQDSDRKTIGTTINAELHRELKERGIKITTAIDKGAQLLILEADGHGVSTENNLLKEEIAQKQRKIEAITKTLQGTCDLWNDRLERVLPMLCVSCRSKAGEVFRQ